MVKVVLPFHLRKLARVDGPEVELQVAPRVTLGAVLDALELHYPTLRGTIRDPLTRKRRPFVRFYACKEDWSLEPADIDLPTEVANGTEPFYVIGAMAGG